MSLIFTLPQLFCCMGLVIMVRLYLLPTRVLVPFLRSKRELISTEALYCIAKRGSGSLAVARAVLECVISSRGEVEDEACKAVSKIGPALRRSLPDLQDALKRLSRMPEKHRAVHELIASIHGFGRAGIKLVPTLIELAAAQNRPIAREVRRAACTLFCQEDFVYFLTSDFLAKLLLNVGVALISDDDGWTGEWNTGLRRIAAHLQRQYARGNFPKSQIDHLENELGLLIFQHPAAGASKQIGEVIEILRRGDDDRVVD